MTHDQRQAEHRLTLSLGATFALFVICSYGLALWVIEQGWAVMP
jgi:hypothetical protein